MAEKRSFLLYTDYFEQIEMLTIEQRGILLTAIMAFQTGTDLPEMDMLTKMAYSFISADMRRDKDKYDEIVEKRRESGRKGGIITQANKANAQSAYFASNSQFKQNQANQANQADSVNVSVNDSENVNENGSVYEGVNVPTDTHQSTNTQTKPPTLDQLKLYCYAEGIRTDVEKFYNYNSGKGWPMEWKQALELWVKKDKEPPKQKPNRFNDNFESRKYGPEFIANLEKVNADRLTQQYGERKEAHG